MVTRSPLTPVIRVQLPDRALSWMTHPSVHPFGVGKLNISFGWAVKVKAYVQSLGDKYRAGRHVFHETAHVIMFVVCQYCVAVLH